MQHCWICCIDGDRRHTVGAAVDPVPQPERALRLLTTSAGFTKGEMLDIVEKLLDEQIDAATLSYPMPAATSRIW
jgi:hypothetical protein